jgi:hypothetical protein
MTQAPPVKHGKLDCDNHGFSFSSHRRESPGALALDLGLAQPRTPSGRISKRKHTPQKRSKGWWEAQVRLYGLKCSKWTIEGMKDVIKAALQREINLEPPAELVKAEQRMKKEYDVVNVQFQRRAAVARNDKWNRLTTDVERANLDVERFLRELLTEGGIKVLRGLNNRAQLHHTAERMGLFSTSTDGVGESYDGRILVVGQDRDAVWQEIHQISAKVATQNQANKHARQQEVDAIHKSLVSHGDGGDIGGTWSLEMPKLTSEYQNGDIEMEIVKPDRSGHVWGSFDLVILEGIVRFDWSSPWKGREKKFTWRGRETGEGEIQYEDDSNTGQVTFSSASKCSGVWRSGYGDFEFTGKKVSNETSASVSRCEEEFECFNEEAYEYARVARWH